ncbi:MAG: hypothetical protein HY292_21180 [Planctomycetes bacterium]|nr:hypothetical protein [Planctomycetota bacterium]
MRSVPLALACRRAVPCAALALAVSSAAFAQQRGTPRVVQSANPLADVRSFSTVELLVPESVDEPFSIDVPIEGETWSLDLEKHSVRSAIFDVRADLGGGRYEPVEPGPIRTFRGTVRDHKGALVAGSILETGLDAVIVMPDGSGYGIQPIGRATPGGLGHYAVYRKEEILTTDARCGVEESRPRGEPAPEEQGIGSSACGNDVCVAQLACDADVEFYQNHDSSTGQVQSRIEALVNIANVEYERDVDITHVITTVIVRTAEPDPYSTTGVTTMLGEMRTYWNANHAGVVRDTAHLFTGKNSTDGFIGFAFIGVICDLANAYGVSQSEFSSATFCDADLIAHEVGHNWGGNHCTCASPPYTMNPSITCSLRFDPAQSIPEITTHRNSRVCLTGGGAGTRDACRDAIPVCNGTYFGTTALATNDGSSNCGTSSTTPDAWFTYVPGTSGTLNLDTCTSGYDTVLSVHSACPGTTTNEIACNDDATATCSGTFQSSVSVAVTGGSRYFIRVSGFNGSTGSFVLHVSGPACPTPSNDACGNALVICPGTYFGSTVTATTDGSATAGTSTSADVWYSYTPAFSGVLGLDLCDSGYDTVVSLHTGCPGTTANEVASNDDGCGGSLSSSLTTNVVAGVTYLIRVSGFSSGNSGPFMLGVTGPDCNHDYCNGAIAIGNGRFFGTLQGTGTDGSASCGSTVASPDVWYRYTAACTGTMVVDSCGTNDLTGVDTGTDTVISLHSGCPGTTGNEITCNDDGFSPCSGAQGNLYDSSVSTSVLAGQQVMIRVSRFFSGKAGLYILNVTCVPANDDCGNATAIGNGTFFGTLSGASNDGSASCGSSDTSPDVYYSYTAPCNGMLRVSTCGTHDAGGIDTGMDTVVSLHTSCPATAGNEIACNDDWSSSSDPIGCTGSDTGSIRDSAVIVPVGAGQVVLIRVAQFGGSAGTGRDFRLNVSCNRPPNTPGAPSHDGHAFETDPEPVSAVTSDPNTDFITYTFDWGDGNMDTSSPTASGTPVTLLHAWTVKGVYDVRVSATDTFGNASAFSAPHAIDVAGIACRTGNVDLDNGGPPVDVLSVNGSAGAGPGRVTSASRSAQITVNLVRAPVSPPEARYAMWVWPTRPTSTSEVTLPFGVGVICMSPLTASCGSACPVIGAKTITGYCSSVLCNTAEATGAVPPGVIIRIPQNRFPAGTVLWVQGVIRDNSDSGPKKVSVTNGVEVNVTP